MTPIALVYFPLPDFAVSWIATIRTAEALGPPEFEQCLPALLLCPRVLHELTDTHTFLELDHVFCHATPPPIEVPISNISVAVE
jgi:hypothetical protein